MVVVAPAVVFVFVPRPKMSSKPPPPLLTPAAAPLEEDMPTTPGPPFTPPPGVADLSPSPPVIIPKKGSLASAAAPTWTWWAWLFRRGYSTCTQRRKHTY